MHQITRLNGRFVTNCKPKSNPPLRTSHGYPSSCFLFVGIKACMCYKRVCACMCPKGGTGSGGNRVTPCSRGDVNMLPWYTSVPLWNSCCKRTHKHRKVLLQQSHQQPLLHLLNKYPCTAMWPQPVRDIKGCKVCCRSSRSDTCLRIPVATSARV